MKYTYSYYIFHSIQKLLEIISAQLQQYSRRGVASDNFFTNFKPCDADDTHGNTEVVEMFSPAESLLSCNSTSERARKENVRRMQVEGVEYV